MHDLLNKRIVVSGGATPTGSAGPVDFNATGDKFMIRRPAPFDVYRWGIITIAAMDPDAGGFQIDLDKRVLVGDDTGRGTADGGSIIRADADVIAASNIVYVDVEVPVAQATGLDGSLVNVEPAGPLRVNPGEEIVFEVTNAVGATSTGYVWAEIAELPFNDFNFSKVTKDA